MSKLAQQFTLDGFCNLKGFVNRMIINEARNEFRSVVVDLKHGERPYSDTELQANYPFAWQLQLKAREFGKLALGLDELPEIVQNQAVLRPAECPASENYHIDGRRLLHERHGDDWSAMPLIEIIVGIPLIDVSEVNYGNLAFLPGGHREIAKAIYDEWESLSAISKPWEAFGRLDEVANKLNRDAEKYTITHCGDIYGIHGLMPHRVLLNYGPERPVWYFRMGVPRKHGRKAFEWASKSG